jgi:hypothetical protein
VPQPILAASACFQRIIGDEKDLIALRDQLDEVVGECIVQNRFFAKARPE